VRQIRLASDDHTPAPGGTPALLDGGPLPAPGVRNLAQALSRAAGGTERTIHFVAADGTRSQTTYAELLDSACRVLGGIRAAGVRAGEPVVLRVAGAQDLLAGFWACVLGGFPAVPVSGGAGPETVAQVRRALGDPWLLTDGDPGPGTTRHAGTVAALRESPPDTGWAAADADTTAALMLTAGSTGAPKAVTLSHGNMLGRSVSTIEANGMTPQSTTFNWMPLDHVGGLVMFHVRDTLLGCDQVHAAREWILADPLRWLDAIDRYRADTTWGTNSSFDLVSDLVEAGGARGWDLSRLRYVMNGGQAVKARTIRRFHANLAPFGLSATAMRPGWGMSETSSGIVDHRLDVRTARDDDRFVPVGRPHPGVRVRVVDDGDRVLPAGVLGHLQVSGAPVTSGYHGDAARTAQAFTADGWFRTGDMAFVEDGALTVTGSRDDMISVGGNVFHGHEIEGAVEELPFVEKTFTVACAVTDPATGADELVVFHSPRANGGEPQDAAERIREIVKNRFHVTVDHVVPVAKDDIPKTGTGKPKRAALRAAFRPAGTDRR
jgi:acyl-CoA synthetase (AMP-forming)/AMP-acid ligase II